MSFTKYKDLVEYGDTVILYLGYDNMLQFLVEKDKTHQTRFGCIKHNDLIGVKFGTKVSCPRGYVYLLHPTPEIWTATLPHRTQIIYSTDISTIILQLDLRCGSVVVEAGTGSGSLSHSIIRTIAPKGHLFTFDFHEQRALRAREDFREHGLQDLVTVGHRDVCSEGFGIKNCTVDAVFLDLPSPWLAIPFASKSLLPGGRICSFSPCIEQVQRSCLAMKENGFNEITTMECLIRPLDVRTFVMAMPDLGYGPGRCYSDGEIRLSKPVVGQVEVTGTGEGDDFNLDRPTKITKLVEPGDSEIDVLEEETNCDVADVPPAGRRNEVGPKASYVCKSIVPPSSSNSTGHTGFLTFATLYPS